MSSMAFSSSIGSTSGGLEAELDCAASDSCPVTVCSTFSARYLIFPSSALSKRSFILESPRIIFFNSCSAFLGMAQSGIGKVSSLHGPALGAFAGRTIPFHDVRCFWRKIKSAKYWSREGLILLCNSHGSCPQWPGQASEAFLVRTVVPSFHFITMRSSACNLFPRQRPSKPPFSENTTLDLPTDS